MPSQFGLFPLIDSSSKTNLFLFTLVGLLYSVILLPLRYLLRLLFFHHRVILCLFLFPVFITTTLVSRLLAVVINHTLSSSSLSQSQPPRMDSPSPSYSSHMDEDSSSSSSEHEDSFSTHREDMDYWLQRCSICFDAPLDLCLEYCRDQYCLDCFRR